MIDTRAGSNPASCNILNKQHLKENIDGLSNGRYFYSNNHRDNVGTPLLAMEEQMKILTLEDLEKEAAQLYKKHFPTSEPLTDTEAKCLIEQIFLRPGVNRENSNN